MNLEMEECLYWITQADGLLICAGAGMGVDSGLPDFRGDEGFWRAYPALAKAGIRFVDAANPKAFRKNGKQAWGFYGHRLKLYRDTTPHDGFTVLRKLGESFPAGYFVFTSNVDGQFQQAGFDRHRIHECHGSIHYLQCSHPHCGQPWPADKLRPVIDEETCQWLGPLPRCPECNSIARPNILMFDDGAWQETRYEIQHVALMRWLNTVSKPLVIELGAGIHIPSVRRFSERYAWRLIRVNPRHPELGDAGSKGIALDIGALAFCQQLGNALTTGQ